MIPKLKLTRRKIAHMNNYATRRAHQVFKNPPSGRLSTVLTLPRLEAIAEEYGYTVTLVDTVHYPEYTVIVYKINFTI